jgi:hypothetical protein
MEVSGQLHAPAALPKGKSPWYPLNMSLGVPRRRFGHGGEEKNSQPPPGRIIFEALHCVFVSIRLSLPLTDAQSATVNWFYIILKKR